MYDCKMKTTLIVSELWLLLTFCAAAPAATHGVGPEEPQQPTIVLPLQLVAGRPATLAVLAANGRIATGVKVVLSDGQVLTTDESGRAHFLLPPDEGVILARIDGTAEREAADVLARDATSGSLQVTHMSSFVSLTSHFAITGAGFQGDADQNRAEIGGTRILVLASSPAELIAMPPAKTTPGPASLVITEGMTEVATNLTFVDVTTVDVSRISVRRGKKSTIAVHVVGTLAPVDLLVRNLSTSVVQFPRGTEQRLRTTGGPDNSAVVELKGIRAGAFSYVISLEDPAIAVNVPVMGTFLQAAAKIAQPDTSNRVATVLQELHGDRLDVFKLRNELDGISNEGGSQDFQALIRAAQRALAGD